MAIALVAFGTAVAQARFVAAPGSPYSAGNEPYGVSAGLFNGDGRLDFAIVNGSSSDVHVFLQQPANGGFALSPNSPFSVGSGPSFATVADFNADGRQDLAVANYVASSISVRLQQADGTFAQEGAAIAVPDSPGAIAAGDFNGDGRADLAFAGWNDSTVRLALRNNANTGFAISGAFNTGGTNPRYIAVGDLDSTGGPDLAITNAGSDTVAVLLGQGGGTFAAASGSPFGVGDGPQFVTIAPLDGDALPDIAVANYGSDNVTVLTRQGGGFGPAAGSPYAVGDAPVGIAAADFRRVGRNDLAVAVSGASSVAILRNDGGTFTRGEDVPVAAGVAPWGIAAGPFNDSDTLPDVAVSSVAGAVNDPVNVFFNLQPPRATTTDASDLAPASATLNAVVNPMGSDTNAYFEYGTTTGYGSRAPAGGDLAAGSDEADHVVSRLVGDLTPNTTYHYRVVTSNAGGQTVGDDVTFTTPPGVPPPSTASGPPQAFLTAPTEVTAGVPTTLSAEGSTPIAGLSFKLDLDGSGQFATDLKTQRSLQTTFTTPGDVNVGLRVTDEAGRTDEVRRTVKVAAPALYGISVSPDNPRPGQRVEFRIREIVDGPSISAAAVRQPLTRGTLATMQFGDGRTPSSVANGLLIRNRAASVTGDFSHRFDQAGSYRVHLAIDDLNGFRQAADLLLRVGRRGDYAPAIGTETTTVEQGSCVGFENATASQLSVDAVGNVLKEDINPVNRMIIVKPSLDDLFMGGEPTFDQQLLSPNVLFNTAISSPIIAGGPRAALQFNTIADLSLDRFNVGGFNFRARPRQAETIETTDGTRACEMQAYMERTTAQAAENFNKPPYPKGGDVGWPAIPTCGGKRPLTTYSTKYSNVTGVTRDSQTTRHTWFSINEWDFGDGTRSGPEAYLPSYKVFHPYDRPGTFNVKLTTTTPTDLDGQAAAWNASCATNPLDPTKKDNRFTQRTAEQKLRVLARYNRIRSRGLWMTSGAGYFTETDLPGVYQSTGSIYINTRRVGFGWNAERTLYDENADVGRANGVMVVTPLDQPLQVVPDRGEIIGPATVHWQSGRGSLKLGNMPLTIGGRPGMVIPQGTGGAHDMGVYNDPPASLTTGSPPPRGAAFHINSAHVILRENNGGRLELNVHLPQPLGPNGGESDETVVRDVRANGRAVTRGRFQARALFDNFDVDIPKVELVPGVISFNGGKLSHHQSENPPWKATGSLTVFGKKVDMSPESKKEGCPVVGGLGFFADGGLANAGAVLDGLRIPIPNLPAPPITAIADPAFQIMPMTSTRPLDLFGCLSLTDYPDGRAFRVTGCAGFLYAGGGVDVPPGEKIPFCPDQLGGEVYQLNEHNSVPAANGRRRMRGIIVRVSGRVGLGPSDFRVANAYIEFRNEPEIAVEFKGNFGQEFLGGAIKIGADLFGYFRGTDDWAIGGSGGVDQSLLCIPNPAELVDDDAKPFCPSAEVAAMVSNQGIGACVTIYAVGIGGVVLFRGPEIIPKFPGCDSEDLEDALGINQRALPGAVDLMAHGRDPVATFSQVQTAKVNLDGGVPHTLLVVSGAGRSPVVEVRDPQGRLVLNDNGQPVQGLPAPKPPSAGEDDAGAPFYKPTASPQGILHNDGSTFHDENVDLRNTTLIVLRNPKKGAYTITAKEGSAPITAIKSADGLPLPRISGGVVRRKGRYMLSVRSRVPAGTTVTLSEESNYGSHRLATLSGARSAANARVAQTSRRMRFKPALGPGGRRQIVATLSRDGIPQRRMLVGSYRAPATPKAGAVRRLRAKAKGSKLTVTWRKARNARRYVITVGLGQGRSFTRSVGAKGRRLVVRDALVRHGATVTVRAIGPLSGEGTAVRRRVKAQKVRKPKRWVL